MRTFIVTGYDGHGDAEWIGDAEDDYQARERAVEAWSKLRGGRVVVIVYSCRAE